MRWVLLRKKLTQVFVPCLAWYSPLFWLFQQVRVLHAIPENVENELFHCLREPISIRASGFSAAFVGISPVTSSKVFVHKVFTDCCILSAVGLAGRSLPWSHGTSRLNSGAQYSQL